MAKVGTSRYYSKKQEDYTASLLGGKTTPNSGACMFTNSDLIVKDVSMCIECKTCMKPKESFSIKKSWLADSEYERISQQLQHSALCFSFGEDEPNYFVLTERDMKKFVELLREESHKPHV